MFALFTKREDRLAPVKALFGRIAEASRQPELYRAGGVPDSFEGRFEALTLHMFLVLRRLRALPAPAADVAQDLVDACFSYLELGFRNGGISDIAVPKRMKKIAQSFYGRIQAYEAAIDAETPDALVEALSRNASAGDGAPRLARYLKRAQAALADRDLATLLREEAPFPAFSREEGSDGC